MPGEQTVSPSEMVRAIGRLEGKMDSALSIVAELRGDFEKMERGRLSKLEVEFATLHTNLGNEMRWRSTITAVVSSIFASFVTGIALYLTIPK